MNKIKFRDLPVGARFRCGDLPDVIEKTSEDVLAHENCIFLPTGEAYWCPGSLWVRRVITEETQLSFLAEFTGGGGDERRNSTNLTS